MVCHQLGYARATSFYNNSRFGPVPKFFSYAYLQCSGHEQNVRQCGYGFMSSDCGPYDGAGVVCENAVESATTTMGPMLDDSSHTNCE